MPNARYQEHLRRSRIALFSVLIPMFPLAFTLGGAVQSFLRLAYILLGFSLIIFLHELGHFVVARACSVKCLAFSIGIGPRMLGWRQGAGVSFGKDPFDPDTAKKADPETRLEHAEVHFLKPVLLGRRVVCWLPDGPFGLIPGRLPAVGRLPVRFAAGGGERARFARPDPALDRHQTGLDTNAIE